MSDTGLYIYCLEFSSDSVEEMPEVLSHYATIAGAGTEYDNEVDKEVVDIFIK